MKRLSPLSLVLLLACGQHPDPNNGLDDESSETAGDDGSGSGSGFGSAGSADDSEDDEPEDDVDTDADGDGHDAPEHGGSDCDDGDATVYPGAYDIPDDGIDQNCDGTDATSGGSGDDGGGDGGSDVDRDGSLTCSWSYTEAGSMYAQWTPGSEESHTYGWVDDEVADSYASTIVFTVGVDEGDYVRISAHTEIEGSGTVFNCDGDGDGMMAYGTLQCQFTGDGFSYTVEDIYFYDKEEESYTGGCEEIVHVVEP